ncbi:MAG: hypothetical protein ACJASV_000181 [Pseudorhodobacter sp.]
MARAFADPTGAGDDQVALICDPLAGEQALEQRLVEAAPRAVIDIFRASAHMALPGRAHPGLEALGLTAGDLTVNQQAKPFSVAEICSSVLCLQFADNKLTELGEWDEAMLCDEIAGLLAEDFDLSLLGITDDDLDALQRDPDQLEGGAVEGEDDIPDAPVTPVSVAGDLWQLGSHRLICGDSTSADVVGRLLGDVCPLLMGTDPPYGVEYDPSWRNQAGVAKTKRTGKVLNDDRADWREAWALFPGDVACVWHGALHSSTVAESLVAAGFAVRSQIIWAKDRLVLSRGDYHWQH